MDQKLRFPAAEQQQRYPDMKRRWQIAAWVGGVIALPALGVILGLVTLMSPFPAELMCGNDVVLEEKSSDGARKAVVFERSCGATTGHSTQVTILPAAALLPNESGNAFIAYVAPSAILLTWEGPRSLTISRPALPKQSIFLAEPQVEEVSVRYETRN